MKRTIRLNESELKGIIREMLNEVALTGKSGKKYSMHGNKRTDKAADDLMNESIRRVIRKMLKESDNVSFEDVPEALSKGVRPQYIFDKIYPEKEGFYMVVLNNKVNYVSTEGKLLSSLWFSDGGDFHNGWAGVGVERREGKIWNLINTKGELFSTEWAHEPWEIISWENEVWGDYSKHPKDGLDEAITHAIRKCLC